ncbi:uncharacterized protein [Dysidea avara]|uniref:uncharacterized protein n=1 Tax=Dysidea avara TaxID=196820 RepID=UPI003325063E
MADANEEFTEPVVFEPDTLCTATRTFVGRDASELTFEEGEFIRIVGPSEMLFWYIGRNETNQTGKVPANFLQEYNEDYIPMDSSGVPTSLASQEDKVMNNLLKQEGKSRLKQGTLVIAKASFVAENPSDLPFEAGEELQILRPTEDLGWYEAKRCHSNGQSKMEGTIPITHIRLIYDDDDSEDESQSEYAVPLPADDRLHDDITDFLTNSGWFSHIGKPHGKEALHYVLAKKSGIEYEQFMVIRKAIYMFAFGNEEKVYIGKADILHKTISEHFECYGKPRASIQAIDDELCHHSMASFWQLQIWPLADSENLELEWAKKVCSKNAIHTPDGHGLNESIKFTETSNWIEFKKWLNPNRS